MKQFRSLPVGNYPLLVIGSALLAFGVTHFYFSPSQSGTLATVCGKVMLVPFYLFRSLFEAVGFGSVSGNVIALFSVLFLAYVTLAFLTSKAIGWYSLRRQGTAG